MSNIPSPPVLIKVLETDHVMIRTQVAAGGTEIKYSTDVYFTSSNI
jgi:hypothetical protein